MLAQSWQRPHILSQQLNWLTLNMNLPRFQEMDGQLVWGIQTTPIFQARNPTTGSTCDQARIKGRRRRP
jgi:hypothetical protein